MSRRILAVLLPLALFGASHGATAQPLRLDAFFNGRLTGTGEVDNYRDGTHRAFKATMVAAWAGPKGTLTEDLSYEDGETKHLVWRFDKTGEGRFTGHRDDLIRDAAVTQDGDAIRMTYTAKTRVPSGKIWTLSFDDRLEQTSSTIVTLQGSVTYLFVGVGVTRMTIVRTAR